MSLKKSIAIGGAASLALALVAVAAPAQAATIDQWDFSNTRAKGHYERTAAGLHIWTDSSISGTAGYDDKVAGYLNVDLPLAETLSGSLEYTANIGIAPGTQFVVDIEGDGTPDGILVGEPVYNGNWWLTNDATAEFKELDPSGSQDGGNGSAYFGTLEQWSAAAPDARIVQVGFSLGSGVAADGVLRAVIAGTNRYTFDPYTVAGCGPLTVLPTATDVDPRGWGDIQNGTWVAGGLELAATASEAAYAYLDLPANTHLADLGDLTTAYSARSSVYAFGVLLYGGGLTKSLHYDDDGRYWTSQKGIFPAKSLKGGFYESTDLAADLQSNPIVESIAVWVNPGQSLTLTAQNYGCLTQPFSLAVDTTKPTFTFTSPADGTPFKASAGVTITADLTDNVGLGDPVINLYQGTTLIKSLGAKPTAGAKAFTGTWTLPAGLAEGVYTLKGGVNDLAGNNRTVTRTIVIDTTRPEFTFTSPADGTPFKASAGVTITADVADANGVGDPVVNLYQGTTLIKSLGAKPTAGAKSSTGTWTLPAGLAEGVYTLKGGVNDLAGNNRTVTSTIVIDTTRPTLSITNPAAGASFAASGGVQVDVEASDAHRLSGVVINLYKADGTLLKSLGTQETGRAAAWAGSWALPTGLADGTYTLRVGTTDLAGNNRTISQPIVIGSTIDAETPGEQGDDEGSDDTGTDDTGTDENGSGDTGTDDGSDENGSEDGSGDGSDENGSDGEDSGETATEKPGAEEPATLSPSLALDVAEIAPGGTVNVTGANFAAGSSVDFELHSKIVELGTGMVDENGAIVFDAVVPASTPAGQHHIVAVLADGSTVEVPITVTEADAAAAPAGTDATPAATTTATTTAGLADTGFEGGALGLAALAAMLLGAAAMAIMSLRRRTAGARG